MLKTAGVADVAAHIYEAANTSPKDCGFGALFKEKKSRIEGLSVSMGTKFLYFASWERGTNQAIIRDKVLYSNMKSLGIGEALNPERHVSASTYATTVGWMQETAQFLNNRVPELSVSGGDVECALFQYKIWKRRQDRLAVLP
jgi:hypothetical protein